MEQLLHSLTWFDNKYIFIGDRYGLSLQYNKKKEANVSIPTNVNVIDHNGLKAIKVSLLKFSTFLSVNSLDKINENDIAIEFQNLHFSEKMFINKYLSNIV